MKVIDVYDANSNLRCHGQNVFDTTRTYLRRFPAEYSACLEYNLKTLELIKVDKIDNDFMTARYNTDENIIEFKTSSALGHEMFHVASNDMVNKQYAFETRLNIEMGLIEGMTEYLYMDAYNLIRPSSYDFEVFTVMMLDHIPGIFKPYFVPSCRGLIGLFPVRKHIYGLLYSLETYNRVMIDYLASIYTDENVLVDLEEYVDAYKYTLANLINIELSIEKNPAKLKRYRDRCLDLLNTSWMHDTMQNTYPDYFEYSERYVTKRIKEKR